MPVQILKDLNHHGIWVFFGKCNVEMTYMKVLLCPENDQLIVFKSNNLDYIEKCLYISCSSSGLIIDRFSTALEWKCQNQIPEGIDFSMLMILFFFIMTQTDQSCKQYLHKFLKICCGCGPKKKTNKTHKHNTTRIIKGTSNTDTTRRQG